MFRYTFLPYLLSTIYISLNKDPFKFRIRNLANTVTKNKFVIGGEEPKDDYPVTFTTDKGKLISFSQKYNYIYSHT